MMRTITFTCELLTPLFMYGADQQTPELRPSGIKGALRFWWRAIQAEQDCRILREKEASIFGAADEKFGRSKLIIEIQGDKLTTGSLKESDFNEVVKRKIQKGNGYGRNAYQSIIRYLGYGPIQFRDANSCFLPGSNFLMKLSIQNDAISDEELVKIVHLMGLFGGLGSRTRNGFGRFITTSNPEQRLTELLKDLSGPDSELPAYTAFSNQITLLGFGSNEYHDSWQSAMSKLGEAYLASRVNYHTHQSSTRNGLENEHYYKKRAFIAMPLKRDRNDVMIDLERHAKTYFFGIERIKNKKLQGYFLHLPYLYLEGNDDFKNRNVNEQNSIRREYQAVNTTFISNLQKNGLTKIL